MKVWVALHWFAYEGSEFCCVAKSKEAAKSFVGSGRNWVDSANGTESEAANKFEGYIVFETEVLGDKKDG